MEKLNSATEIKTIIPQELATKLHTTPKRLRVILRAEFPRETKGKKWEITPEVAKKVTKAFKAKVKAKTKQELRSG